jgi:hypothetical protein
VREHEKAESMGTPFSGLMNVESTLVAHPYEIESTGFEIEASRRRIESRLVVIRRIIYSILGIGEL